MLRSTNYNPAENLKKEVVENESDDDEFNNCDLDENDIEENPDGLDKFKTNDMQTYTNQNMSIR